MLVPSDACASRAPGNWVKYNKKTRLRKDNLWFLTPDDARCAADFDPHQQQCQRLCVPVKYCAQGKPCIAEESCARLQHPKAQ